MTDRSSGPGTDHGFGGGGLGPDARALLDAARGGLSPDAAAVHRMRGKIELAATGAAGTALGLKLVLLALAIVVVAGGAVVLGRRATVADVPQVELTSPPEHAVRVAAREAALPPLVDDDLITIDPPPTAPVADNRPALAVNRAPLAVPRVPLADSRAPLAVPRVPPAPAAEPRTVDLAREVELLDLAMAASRRGDPHAALRAVQQHARETAGRGQLAEDAAAIEVEALCALRDPAAPARLAAFDARFPRSAQRARLSDRCAPPT